MKNVIGRTLILLHAQSVVSLVAAGVPLLVTLLLTGSVPCDAGANRGTRSATPTEMATERLMQQIGGNFRPSQEMKENVDFLLTPAILLQEAITDEVVVTYPSE